MSEPETPRPKVKLVSTNETLRGSKRNPNACPPKPPRPLNKAGHDLWNRIMREYAISDSGGIETLCLACEALDRAQAAHEQVQRDGMILSTRQGFKDHPLLRHELSNRTAVARLLTKLGLAFEPPKPVGRPVGGGLGIQRTFKQDCED
jgi:P27 family predicted phage terminase small subunit